ncbi:uncharacterized protein F4807DRAFT_467877 [Annulohypoxylon truncatum]|uniref:uncharacterized protein n=1 Tax=Annulohypoxylon truncatum TaxID=327061 RepID=UPI0020082D4B|nr:uncharacterized protein F4807DRAFT_467877 [Annulohypoxylon truncatum]KAI1209324.1 hypothetical protein F4807DRAFT_467877 [Annulohypoxylon truncatum]
MDKNTHEKTSGKLRRRCHSLPSLKILSKVREESHILGENIHRSISRSSKVKHLPSTLPQYLATVRGSRLVSQPEDEDYDSDEEDRKNGVPIIVTENRGCKFNPTMTTNVSREIREKLEKKRKLQELQAIAEPRYLQARARYFERRGLDWDIQVWSNFFRLEDNYFKITDKIYNIECEITNLEAKLSSFTTNHIFNRKTGHWNIEGNGTRTWFLDGGDNKQDT